MIGDLILFLFWQHEGETKNGFSHLSRRESILECKDRIELQLNLIVEFIFTVQ